MLLFSRLKLRLIFRSNSYGSHLLLIFSQGIVFGQSIVCSYDIKDLKAICLGKYLVVFNGFVHYLKLEIIEDIKVLEVKTFVPFRISTIFYSSGGLELLIVKNELNIGIKCSKLRIVFNKSGLNNAYYKLTTLILH